MQILFVDNHLLIVDKPAGLSTQPDLVEMARGWIKKEFSKPGNVFLEPAHRLDKPVSGIVLFARTSKALERLNEMMRKREIVKVYHAWVEGTPSKPEDTLEHFLIHGDHKAIVSSPSHPDAKKAILSYRILETRGERTLLEVVLETGRYHQIRAQFSAIGHPICGDMKYGSRSNGSLSLRHVKMQFKHPVTHQVVISEACE